MKKIVLIITIVLFASSAYAEDQRFDAYLNKLKSGKYLQELEFKKYNFRETVNRMAHKRDVVREAFKILHDFYETKWSIDAAYHLCGCNSPFDLTKEEHLSVTLGVLHLLEKKMHYQDTSFIFECRSALVYMIEGYEFAASRVLNEFVASKEQNYCQDRQLCNEKQ